MESGGGISQFGSAGCENEWVGMVELWHQEESITFRCKKDEGARLERPLNRRELNPCGSEHPGGEKNEFSIATTVGSG